MSAEKQTIFFTGATGYIGGTVLSKLLKHPKAAAFEIVALVRNADKARILESKFNVKAVVGSHQDLDKIHDLVAKSDFVFHLADADDEPLIRTILKAQKERHAKTGKVPVLIHTSGTGVLTDDSHGEYATEIIYDDLNVEQIKSIPPTALHRNVDLLIFEADSEGYARTHIITPSTIYGLAKHPLVDAGVSNQHSVQIPIIVKASLDRKRAGVVGKGKSIWPDVHIDDVADLYIVLFDGILNNPDKTGHGWEGFYFGENGEHTWYQISQAIGEALVKLGIADDATPTTFTVEELVKYFGSEKAGWYSGTNSRCRANRGRSIGWKPKHTTEDMLQSILPEVEAIWKKMKE
ncbi:NAD-P-binding protein [Earliella scabrosa]|nr:NAD-P-binding protein [Earliella scabrosa]